MTAWADPRIVWRPGVDSAAEYDRLTQTAELLTRWPPAPFETSATDCFKAGADFWIWQPGVGGIRFTAVDPSFDAFPASTVDPAWFEYLVTRSWMPAVYQVWGRQVLHASAAARTSTGDVFAFTGPSGAGKSTMAFSLAQRPGWTLVADDTLAFSVSGGAIELHPLRNEARLRPATAAYHGRRDEAPQPVEWPDVALTLRRVYVLDGVDAAPEAAVIGPLGAAEGYTRLLEQAHAFTLQIPAFNQQLMRDYLALAAAVPLVRLTYRRSFDSMTAILDRIEQHDTGAATRQ